MCEITEGVVPTAAATLDLMTAADRELVRRGTHNRVA
jgi:hypothetical protein